MLAMSPPIGEPLPLHAEQGFFGAHAVVNAQSDAAVVTELKFRDITAQLPIRLAQLALDVVSGPSDVRAAARSGFPYASEAQDRFASEEGRRPCLVACQLSARPTSTAGGHWSRRSGSRSARPRDITTHPQDVVRG